jgi:hypothetical protein
MTSESKSEPTFFAFRSNQHLTAGAEAICRFRGGPRDGGYDLKDVAFFADYVVPRNIWYLIPAAVILTPSPTMAIAVCPEVLPSWDCYRYERHREAWGLLGKDRRELFQRGKH